MIPYKWISLLSILIGWVILAVWHPYSTNAQSPSKDGPVYRVIFMTPTPTPNSFPIGPGTPVPIPPSPDRCSPPSFEMIDFSDNEVAVVIHNFDEANTAVNLNLDNGISYSGLSDILELSATDIHQLDLTFRYGNQNSSCDSKSSQVSFFIDPSQKDYLPFFKQQGIPFMLASGIDSPNIDVPDADKPFVSVQSSLDDSTTRYIFDETTPFWSALNQANQRTDLLPESWKVHEVKSGDSLWRLAETEYGSGVDWVAIYMATNIQGRGDNDTSPLLNPNNLQVGQKIQIPNYEATPTP